MNTIIAKIGKYILQKNKLKNSRQRARSKVGYYENLFKAIGEDPAVPPRGWSRWNKAGAKEKLRILVKKHKIEQMQMELEMHELAISFRKELIRLRKQMPHRLVYNSDYVVGIAMPDGGSKWNESILWLKDIEQIVINEEAERILLQREA